ncbi:putative transposase [Escherichia coli MP021017.5]|nr:putative transposase [Escherichia coli MP021017.9]EMU75841.1 putative transposase [Escherichia coli MP021017.5]EMU82080.1 putative transposase [Escherichia coli MP021017.6]EMU96578.1 putative transposase [Escherichia coli MP021017.3]EMV02559.1 putative transposase [Escherichia coli MP021017.4]EMV03160.1 putative transposase [Escherichia coli MP021017.2]EMV06166.1 putative transposase [Escherichia coli MP021017.11]EMV07232.1 putative transposase [Escherichia coli MP021017.10]EMV28261.1 pu
MGGNSKNSTLFISLLKRLKATYRRAKIITLWTTTLSTKAEKHSPG